MCWYLKDSDLLDFLYDVAKDPEKLQQFKDDGGCAKKPLFTISADFIPALNEGIISSKLKEVFEQNGVILNQDSTVSLSGWVITNGGAEPYSITKEATDLEIFQGVPGGVPLFTLLHDPYLAQLDKCELSDALRNQFDSHGHPLTAAAQVIELGWAIESGGVTDYTITKDESDPKVLDVFQQYPVMASLSNEHKSLLMSSDKDAIFEALLGNIH